MRWKACLFPAMVIAAQFSLARGADNPIQPDKSGNSASASVVSVNADKVVHVMAGGAGASWQAIGPTGFFYKSTPKSAKSGRQGRRARGSGWGGTPLVEETKAWEDLRRHSRWLGLDFVRVEVDMRMYEPQRGVFEWDNDEMQMLYRILDICQENQADVFFSQMWQDADWNTHEGVSRLASAPKSVPDFANGLCTLMEHLIKKKGYTCIRWVCLVNEPGEHWGWWIGSNGLPQSLMPAIKAVRAELDRRGLAVGISAPDFAYPQRTKLKIFDWNDPAVGAFDMHDYFASPAEPWIPPLVKQAHARGVPFFISEFGTWVGKDPEGYPTSDVPKLYANQLNNARKVLRGLNLGVDGFNRWSFTNRGDLDGAWQLVRTWDPIGWKYLPRVTPEPVPYYSYGILTRFMAKHSSVLETRTQGDRVMAAALRSPKGNVTVYVLNKSAAKEAVTLTLADLKGLGSLHKYQVTEELIGKDGYQMKPLETYQITGGTLSAHETLPPQSITVYSSYRLMPDDPGVISD